MATVHPGDGSSQPLPPNPRQKMSSMSAQIAHSFAKKFNDNLDKALQASLSNKSCQRMFRSIQAIREEQIRHRSINRFMIHPFSTFRWYWDLVMVLTLMTTLLSLPVEIAFFSHDDSGEHSWMATNIIVDIIFLIDIAFNFRTGYLCVEEVELRSFRSVVHYMKTWFLIDLVSSVPFDYLYQAIWGTNESVYLTLRVLRLTKLLALLRILRVARLLRYVHKLEEILEIESKIINIVNLVMVILVFSHWNACLQYLVSFMEDFPADSWVTLDKLADNTTTPWAKYSASLFRALSHMLSIGYGYEPPQSLTDTWVVIFSMTTGATFYALFVGNMSALIMTIDSSGRKYEEKVSEVKQYMKFRRVPVSTQQQVLEYYDHKYQRKFFDELGILYEPYMSSPLRQQILLHNCKNLVEKVPFLSSAPTDFLYEIICRLQFQVFFPGDVVIQSGHKGDSMYFIEHGKVEVRVNQTQVLNTLNDGAYFGEIALLLEERRVASIVAVEICDMYCLTKANFNEVLDEHPRMKQVLERIARQRIEELNQDQEQRKFNKDPKSPVAVAPCGTNSLHIADEANDIEAVEIGAPII